MIRRVTLRVGLSFWCLGLLPLVTLGAEAPENDWRTAAPEEVGMDSEMLVEMFDFVREKKIPLHSVQIVRHGRLALDAYFYPYQSGMRHDVASVTKSITSTLVGLAMQRGYVRDVHQRLLALFPDRTCANLDERKRMLSIEHLLTMSAGWDCGFEAHEARLFEMRRSTDWLQFMLDLPMVTQPGTRWAYCSGNCHVLSVLLSNVTATNALAFARRDLFAPLQIEDVAWASDSRGNSHGWGDLQLHPRDMARIGQMFLQHGRWAGQQIISQAWIEASTRVHVERTSNKDHYGYFWWVKGNDYPGMFEAVGRGGQRINVWPAKNLVLVFTGGGFEPGELAPFILKALKSDKPLPANPENYARLKKLLDAATNAPSAQMSPPTSSLGKKISGRVFELSRNSLDLKGLALNFQNSAQAKVEFVWERDRVTIPMGLDGVERFSMNSLNGLMQGAKGRWLNEHIFLLTLDLIGGINFYELTLDFAEGGNEVKVDLNERTGLVKEQFNGVFREG